MKIIKGKIEDYQKEIIKTLRENGTIVFAFDTVYGLVADPSSEIAVNKIYQIKGRDFNKPLALIFSDLNEVKKFVDLNDEQLKKLKKILPGKYTIIAKKKTKKNLSSHYKKLTSLGFRIPNDDSIRDLIKKYGSPITATSANISGQENCWSINDFLKQINKQELKPDLIIDSGIIEQNPPSKVIDLINNQILRN